MTEPEKDRELLRRAGEHLGTLAQRAKERYELSWEPRRPDHYVWERHVRLARLSREMLELAND